MIKNLTLFIILLFSLNSFGQNFERNWKKVIEYEEVGSIKSAFKEVNKIYKKAKRRGDELEIIKTFFFRSKYIQKLEEDAQSLIIKNIKSDIAEISEPNKAVLEYIYITSLNDYLRRNKYQIQGRTATESTFNPDFQSWSLPDFEREVDFYISKSLANKNSLKNTALIDFESILYFEKLALLENRNLYEFLLEKYIEIYASHINRWDEVPPLFSTIKQSVLGESSEFTSLKFDSLPDSNLKKTTLLYQELERSNLTDRRYELKRLQFFDTYVYKDSEGFLQILTRFQNATKKTELRQEVQLLRANLYSKLASKDKHPEYNKTAIQVLDSILKIESRSNTYKLAFIKKEQILSKEIKVKLQRFVYEGENTRAFVNFKNADSLFLKAYKVSNDFEIPNNAFQRDSWITNIIRNGNQQQPTSYKLPNKEDFFEYSTEILLPLLPKGTYLMLFEADKSGFNKTDNFNYLFVTVSDFSVLQKSRNNVDYLQVVDRKTGQPKKDVSIAFANTKVKTNEQGTVAVENWKPHIGNNRNSLAEVTNATDTLNVNFHRGYYKKYNNDDYEAYFGKVQFFLDRAIYRPGQKVYVKGIALQKKNGVKSTVPNLTVYVEISDPNYNTVKELEIQTNEFGSFTFEFIIPKDGPTGRYSIEVDEPDNIENDPLYNEEDEEHLFWDFVDFNFSAVNFNVEEYKRPTFKIEFEPIKETVVVNQEVTVSGKATAFSGVNLDASKVIYRVERNSYPSYWRTYYSEETKTIAEGETITEDDGSFKIDFTAIPYSSMDKKELPVFHYTVYADITDARGETQSSQTTVKVGYHNLALTAVIPQLINTKNENVLTLNSTNLNGEFLATKGKVEIYYQSKIESKFKDRVFPNPEIPGFTEEEFEKLFPFEKNTNSEKQLEVLVFSKEINTETENELSLDFLKEKAIGNYKLVFSAVDTEDNLIKTSSEFKVIHSDTDLVNKLFTLTQKNDNPFKDGFAELEVRSEIKTIFLNVSNNGTSSSEILHIKLEDGYSKIRIPIDSKRTDNVNLSFESYFENQLFTESFPIAKKESGEINIAIKTFRNKIEPGSKQTWSFSITKKDKATEAEVLASMYDSSLDQFKVEDWNKLNFRHYYGYSNYSRTSNLSNSDSYTRLRNLNSELPRFQFSNNNVDIFWFGFDFANPSNNLIFKHSKKAISKIPSNASTVYGIITDDSGLPLPGANVIVKGTNRGTQSDFDGYYSIDVAQGEELVFSYVGFDTQEINVKSDEYDISLDPGASLEEVVVTGYSSSEKTVQTSAIVSYKIDDILAGKVSGVTINQETGKPGQGATVKIRGSGSLSPGTSNVLVIIDGVPVNSDKNSEDTADILASLNNDDIANISILKGNEATALYGSRGANGVIIITTKSGLQELTEVKTRTNFNETAFFEPQLRTDKKGNISFNFTSPEALTQWKLRLLAHNKKAESGYLENFVITQKELMIVPNMPRFFREKDSISISARISNLTSENKTGIAMLQLFDAVSMKRIDIEMGNEINHRNFQTSAKGNTTVSWKIRIPEGVQGVQYKVVAKSGKFTDGEENLIPVLTNTILVTESIPIWVRRNTTKEYSFEKLKNNTSTTLKNHQLTLEYTSNPTWLAIQALPYLIEYEHDCSEQVFARFYANSIASEILNSNPRIAAYFKTKEPLDLKSELEQNEELKSIILSETPWFRDSESEEEKKARLALFFNLDKLQESQESTFKKLQNQQMANGAFPWFEGGRESEFITRYIVAGFGKLNKQTDSIAFDYKAITDKAIRFLDNKTEKRYYKNKGLTNFNSFLNIRKTHYLYTRSFYLKSNKISDSLQLAIDKDLASLKDNWLQTSLFQKAMAAIVLHRFGDSKTAEKIINNLKETSSNNEDWGMYWIENKPGWYWYNAPIETQALLIEAFSEIENDRKSVEAMKVWLLKNKQVKHWSSTKSTTEAINSMLQYGKDWTDVKDKTKFKLGDSKLLKQKLAEVEKEVETGYFKLNFKPSEIQKDMADLSINNKCDVPGFGGFYWQYFEQADKIESNSDKPLSIKKELYLKKNTSTGQQLQRITEENQLKLGDLITVRLIIATKENMEFVHLKDMRASAFEPVDVLSEYEYKDGLGYYKSTRDAATHFFFDNISKGTYVLEYDVRANNIGNFSNGIITIQSMYAPEFGDHSEGIRVTILE